jgi:hypothetical protein
MKRFSVFIVVSLFLILGTAGAQYTPWLYWTFLPQEQMDEIVGEASGEAAWRTIATINAYNRDRLPEEFTGTFFETQYVSDQLKRWGLEGVEIVAYPGGEAWDAIKGDLWEVKPRHQKLASYTDMPFLSLPQIRLKSRPTSIK